jgi:uncharacterized protein YxjI
MTEEAMFRRHGDDGHGAGAGPNVYQMRQQMLSIGDDYWIENGAGQRAFKVDGKALRIHKTLIVETPAGQQLFKIEHKIVTIKDTWTIEDGAGTVATVKKALISPIHERYSVDLRSGGEWDIKGNIVDHEYEMKGPAGIVATVGKKWFRVRDTYGVQVSPGQDDALVLAVAIVVDQISHPMR